MPGEEGVIYGYNRHLYGGIEPSTMKTFSVIKGSDSIYPMITAIPPDDTIVDEEVLCSVAGTKIIYNLYHEPVNEFDGEIVAELKLGETLSGWLWSPPEIDGIVPTAFLKAFPYSTNNVYGRNSKNCAIFNPPPAVEALSVTQTFDSEAQKYNVNLSITVPTVINKVVVGRINGTLMGDLTITPEECEKTWVVENDTMTSDGSSKTLSVIDTEVESAQQYIYIVFPSISNDIYNTDTTNRISVTVSDATPPGDLTALSLVSLDQEGAVRINIDWPEDCDGVTIVYKTGSYPANINDGTVKNQLHHNPSDPTQVYYHPIWNGLTPGETYYFRFFPYRNNTESDGSVTKIHNMNNTDANKASVEMRKHSYLFGFDLNEDDPDPTTRIAYPDDVDNVGWDPVTAIKSSSASNAFGNWSWIAQPGQYFIPRPCIIDFDGNFIEYLNPNNYAVNISGAQSKADAVNEKVNVMLEFKKLYTKRWEYTNSSGQKIYSFRISDMMIDSYYDCWCNYSIDDKTIPKFYISAYTVLNISSKFDDSSSSVYKQRSITYTSNGGTYRTKTIGEIFSINQTSNMPGENWYNQTLAQAMLFHDIFLLVTKTTAFGSIFGWGKNNDSYVEYGNIPKPGYLNSKGMFYKQNAYEIKLFGIEDLYTNYTTVYSGIMFAYNYTSDTNQYTKFRYKITPGNHDGTLVIGFKTNDSVNTTQKWRLSDSNLTTQTSRDYSPSMDVYPWGRLPKDSTTTGSSSTYEVFVTAAKTAKQIKNQLSTYPLTEYPRFCGAGCMDIGFQWPYSTQAGSKDANWHLTYIPTESDNLGMNDMKVTDPI